MNHGNQLLTDHCRSFMIYCKTSTYSQTPPTVWESWKQNLFEHNLRFEMNRSLEHLKIEKHHPQNYVKKELASFDGFWFFCEGQKKSPWHTHYMVIGVMIHSGMFMELLSRHCCPRPKSRTLNLTSISQELQDCSTSKWNGETVKLKIWVPVSPVPWVNQHVLGELEGLVHWSWKEMEG